jgi:hypothetical protein
LLLEVASGLLITGIICALRPRNRFIETQPTYLYTF